MPIPQPPRQLQGHCAAVYDDVLYVLSPTGLQSLPIKSKAQWSKEPSGVLVSGAACVKVGSGRNAALYVIGGQTTAKRFSGLQRYFFANKRWETLSSLSSDIISQRTDHSIAYLEDSQSILVYAGSQPNAPSTLSSQTFLISTKPPYNIESFISSAPPANLPILLPWTSNSAIMLGGAEGNTEIYTFDPTDGWQAYGTNLTEAPDRSSRGTIVQGQGALRVLELYDFSVSPNSVQQIVLQDANGNPAPPGTTVGSRPKSRKQTRGLSSVGWPPYNDKNAPTAIREDCSLSQNDAGLAIVAGGSSAVPVALFNQDRNSWVDASRFFDSAVTQKPLLQSSTSAQVPTSTATTTEPPAPTAPGSSGSNGGTSHPRKTLGIILGVLFGVAVIFALLLLFFRYRRRQLRKGAGERNEKSGDRMSFQDRGASFTDGSGLGGAVSLPNHSADRLQSDSRSSLAALGSKFTSKRNTADLKIKSSFESTANLVRKVEDDSVEMININGQPIPINFAPPPTTSSTAKYGSTLTVDNNAKARRKRSSGWSKYFATSGPAGPNGLSHIPDAYVDPQDRASVQDPTPQVYIPALDLGNHKDLENLRLSGSRLSNVATGSPSFSDSREDIARQGNSNFSHEGQAGIIVDPSRPRSLSESISSYTRSTVSSMMTSEYYNESGHTAWTPTTGNFKDHLNSYGRHTSSLYSNGSASEARIPSRGKSPGFYPGAGTSYRPPRKPRKTTTGTTSDVAMLDWPTPPNRILSAAKQPEIAAEVEQSQRVSGIPRTLSSARYAGQPRIRDNSTDLGKKPMSSDLTWLDLGSNNALSSI